MLSNGEWWNWICKAHATCKTFVSSSVWIWMKWLSSRFKGRESHSVIVNLCHTNKQVCVSSCDALKILVSCCLFNTLSVYSVWLIFLADSFTRRQCRQTPDERQAGIDTTPLFNSTSTETIPITPSLPQPVSGLKSADTGQNIFWS